MRFEGNLTAWNTERGYGAIEPKQGGLELFVHVSAFPIGSAPPALGEPLSFEIVSDGDGAKRAVKVLRSEQAQTTPQQRVLGAAPLRRRPSAARGQRLGLSLGVVVLLLAVGMLGWLHLSQPGGPLLAQRVSSLMR